MKTYLIIAFLLATAVGVAQQQDAAPDATEEQRLEDITESEEAELEDDYALQQLANYSRHPLNLNSANETELEAFGELSPLLIKNLFVYRKLLGNLQNIYELQAIPGFSIDLIRKILPYITISSTATFSQSITERLHNGERSLLLRSALVMEPSNGFSINDSLTSSPEHFYGSRPKLMVRYNYQYKQLLHYGIVGDKDAGEQFFRGNQKSGFDFYSFHFFIRKWRWIKALAIGDYTVNLGQGLIHWQGLAYKKGAGVVTVKRQSEALRPYQSPGEYNFHRGLASVFEKGPWRAFVFISARKISANLSPGSGIFSGREVISSILSSGLHRTPDEISDRNNISLNSYGGSLQFSRPSFHIAFNLVHVHFSLPVQKREEPYNLYSFSGQEWRNASIDYSFTARNFHFFGEIAVDAHYHKAFLSGLMLSLGKTLDIAITFRKIGKAYQSHYGNAFTENLMPSNEDGGYAGLTLKPAQAWRIDLYADLFSFPWLKYRVNAPGHGLQYLAQVVWKPDKKIEVYSRYRLKVRPANKSMEGSPFPSIGEQSGVNWRTHISLQVTQNIMIRNRLEFCWIRQPGSGRPEPGSLMYVDISCKRFFKLFSGNFRIQFFETRGYDSRLYAYENDLPFSSSIPSFSDKGKRCYVNLKRSFQLKKTGFQTGLKISRTLYSGKTVIGNGSDAIQSPGKTEIRAQVLLKWG